MGNQFSKRQNCEPSNCTKHGEPRKEPHPYRAAQQFINEGRRHKCCTIVGNCVQEWQLPADQQCVELTTAMGTTFYYNNKLSVCK